MHTFLCGLGEREAVEGDSVQVVFERLLVHSDQIPLELHKLVRRVPARRSMCAVAIVVDRKRRRACQVRHIAEEDREREASRLKSHKRACIPGKQSSRCRISKSTYLWRAWPRWQRTSAGATGRGQPVAATPACLQEKVRSGVSETASECFQKHGQTACTHLDPYVVHREGMMKGGHPYPRAGGVGEHAAWLKDRLYSSTGRLT